MQSDLIMGWTVEGTKDAVACVDGDRSNPRPDKRGWPITMGA